MKFDNIKLESILELPERLVVKINCPVHCPVSRKPPTPNLILFFLVLLLPYALALELEIPSLIWGLYTLQWILKIPRKKHLFMTHYSLHLGRWPKQSLCYNNSHFLKKQYRLLLAPCFYPYWSFPFLPQNQGNRIRGFEKEIARIPNPLLCELL